VHPSEFLGNQDAARKRRRVGQRCGAWARKVVHTDKGLVRRFFSQERWDKLKALLTWMRSALGTRADRKKFLSARGFMVYASMTYLFMRPFMKGTHMSAESWWGGRDAEGWKVAGSKPGPKPTGYDHEYSEELEY
jgi:hypothetical protein